MATRNPAPVDGLDIGKVSITHGRKDLRIFASFRPAKRFHLCVLLSTLSAEQDPCHGARGTTKDTPSPGDMKIMKP